MRLREDIISECSDCMPGKVVTTLSRPVATMVPKAVLDRPMGWWSLGGGGHQAIDSSTAASLINHLPEVREMRCLQVRRGVLHVLRIHRSEKSQPCPCPLPPQPKQDTTCLGRRGHRLIHSCTHPDRRTLRLKNQRLNSQAPRRERAGRESAPGVVHVSNQNSSTHSSSHTTCVGAGSVTRKCGPLGWAAL